MLYRPVLPSALLLLAATVGPAAAQNLIVNGGFDSGIVGWVESGGVGAVDWSSTDAGSLPGSGSLRFTLSGSEAHVAFTVAQCVPVQAGIEYETGADYFIPSGQSRTGSGFLSLIFSHGTSCGELFATAINFPPFVAQGAWGRLGGTASAPAAAGSVLVLVYAEKTEAGGSLVVHADNVVVRPGVPNLLVNPRFDTGIQGWSPLAGSGTADWSSTDASGDSVPSSGSLRQVVTGAGEHTTVATGQCIAVEGGVEYEAAADFLIPGGQLRTGAAFLGMSLAQDDHCSFVVDGFTSGAVTTPGSWSRRSRRFVTPPGVHSARVFPVAEKTEAGGSLVVHADNVLFRPASPGCSPDPATLCLQGGRFRVTASWKTAAGTTGAGQAVALTGETGYFWFFAAANVEVLVKVIDACAAPFDRYWTFAAGLTNVYVRLEVTDTLTGAQRIYENPQGRDFVAVLDTAAFATCP